MEKKEVKVLEFIEKIDNKDFGFYFFTLDTKGNPTAGIANIYEHVKVLNNLGYKAYILHEKNDYHDVGEWLGEEYASLPHVSIENQDLNLTAIDYIIIPEIFSNIMESVKDFPCKKIVFAQAYSYILDIIGLNVRWDLNYGFRDVITTSQSQANYIKDLFPSIDTHVIAPSIPDYFKTTDKLKKPIVSILTRDQKTALKIVKSFYLKYPMYKWLTFRELRGLPRQTFAEQLGQSCLAVWVDDIAGFGTFPLEAIESETPIIAKVPTLLPEWAVDNISEDGSIKMKNNAIWTNNELAIPELISEYIKVWIEDNVPTNLIEGIKDSKGKYTEEKQIKSIKEVYSNLVANRKSEFEALLNNKENENTIK